MDRPRVLIVDPDNESQTLIRRVLSRHCDLIFQNDPLYFFDALEIFEPDLIITELELPQLSGFELINLAHGEPGYRHIPIMVFSARHDVEDQKLVYRLGAIHFQAKPARPTQLFKGASMFVRLLSQPRTPKLLTKKESERRLAQRQSEHHVHPLLEQAIGIHRTEPSNAMRGERSILAAVAGRRTGGS